MIIAVQKGIKKVHLVNLPWEEKSCIPVDIDLTQSWGTLQCCSDLCLTRGPETKAQNIWNPKSENLWQFGADSHFIQVEWQVSGCRCNDRTCVQLLFLLEPLPQNNRWCKPRLRREPESEYDTMNLMYWQRLLPETFQLQVDQEQGFNKV